MPFLMYSTHYSHLLITVVFSLLVLPQHSRVCAFQVDFLGRNCKTPSNTAMTSASTQNDANVDSSKPRVLKVLALHGSEGTGPDFVERLQPLVDALATENVELQLTAITAPFEKGEGKAWWIMPPGIRSFTATEYKGFEKSASLVLDALEKEGPFDILLGHSQGAILLSALLALNRIPNHPLIGYILNGVAMPNPFKSELEALRFEQNGNAPRVLFVLGENDKINAIEIGNQVKDAMDEAGLDVSVCYHPGGHSVPVKNDDAVERISTWITDGII